MCLLCLLSRCFELDTATALPPSGAAEQSLTVGQGWTRWLHPPWVGPPKPKWPSHWFKSPGEGGDPWLKSQPWRKAQLKYSLSSMQPPSRAVLTAWNEGHHSSWRNSSCTHWLRNYLLHTLHLPILAACLRFMNRGGNQGNVTYRIFLDIKFMSHCWSIYNSSQIAMQIFG